MSYLHRLPFGVRVARKIWPEPLLPKLCLYKTSVLLITYMAYTCYHMSRKPISVVKSVLHFNRTDVDNTTHVGGYAPFDGDDYDELFGTMDSAFLFSYAISMFVSGILAERACLRYYLAFGMILSGITSYLFGVAKTLNIHSVEYFLAVQAAAGIVQTTGWPGVVTVVGRWFGKSKRGLIFGIWNSHTSVGNIIGSLIAAQYVENDWALSFIVPSIIISVMGFIVFLFLVDSPESAGYVSGGETMAHADENTLTHGMDSDITYSPTERTPILPSSSPTAHNKKAIGMMGAIKIPGVVDYASCLFFSKLVSYTFLYWLPLYIEASTTLDARLSADLSTLFDVGGIVGAIAAGSISDASGMPAITCCAMLLLAVPALILYHNYASVSMVINICLLVLAGVLVNGPYALITTSVSAELGTHSSLEGNAKALATVTAIIDGTGSIGAAVGPLLAGVLAQYGWDKVFLMLIISDFLATFMLSRMARKELSRIRANLTNR